MATKRIAVLVTDRQEEALRMSLGLLLLGDEVDVFVLGRALEPTDKNALHLETMAEMEMKVYSDLPGIPGTESLTTEAIARKLPDYDHVLPY